MKKHFLLAATSLSLSLTAFAGGIDEVAVLVPEIVIPKLPGGFFVGGSGYYLQLSATAEELDYASVNQQPVLNLFDPVTNSLFAVQPSQLGHLTPNYSWGWGAFIGYTFPGTGNDITLDYFHFQGSKNNSKEVVPDPSVLAGDTNSPLPISSDIDPTVIFSGTPVATIAQGHVGFSVNQADLTLGQFINIGSDLQVHPTIGLRWATIHRDLSATFTSPVVEGGNGGGLGVAVTAPTEIVQATNTNSHYTGLGPVLGLDVTYDLWYGFAAVGHLDGAILAGNVHTELSSNFNSFALIYSTIISPPFNTTVTPQANQFNYSATSSDIRRLVPVVDAKLGLNYVYDFKDSMLLTAEVGWGLTNYFNVVDGLTADDFSIIGSLLNTGTSFASIGSKTIPPARITGHHTADIAIQGLYFDLMLTL